MTRHESKLLNEEKKKKLKKEMLYQNNKLSRLFGKSKLLCKVIDITIVTEMNPKRGIYERAFRYTLQYRALKFTSKPFFIRHERLRVVNYI
jgi:hypothetical protein